MSLAERVLALPGVISAHRRLADESRMNGVRVPDGSGEVVPDEKKPNVDALRSVVREGDHVATVGGGNGVTAVRASRFAGGDGRVDVYEAGREQVALLEAVRHGNLTRAPIEIHHARVGDGGEVYGDADGAERVPVRDLPPADVLELDCEGAETIILDGLAHRPRHIIVETHPLYGSETGVVDRLLLKAGYDTVSRAPDSQDGHVLTARRREGLYA